MEVEAEEALEEEGDNKIVLLLNVSNATTVATTKMSVLSRIKKQIMLRKRKCC